MSAFGWSSTTDEVLEGIDLSGQTAFITGANSGLGQETARAMAAKGAHVVLAGRDQAKLDEAVAAIRATVPKAQLDTITVDLASLESIRAATSRARQRFARIDLLINNAGVMATPFEHTADGFERQFGTNHLGHFALTAELMPLIEAGDAKRIVNLSSQAGKHGFPLRSPYAAAKWAVIGLMKTVAMELGPHGIRANAICPGSVNGPRITSVIEAEAAAKGSSSASYYLGLLYFEGKQVPQDYPKAKSYFEKARQHPNAQRYLEQWSELTAPGGAAKKQPN